MRRQLWCDQILVQFGVKNKGKDFPASLDRPLEEVARYPADFKKTPEQLLNEIRALGFDYDSGGEIIKDLNGCCFSVDDLASFFDVSPSLVYKWIQHSKGAQVSGAAEFPAWRLPRLKAFLALLEENNVAGLAKLGSISEREALEYVRNWRKVSDLRGVTGAVNSMAETLGLENPAQILDVVSFSEWISDYKPIDLVGSQTQMFKYFESWSKNSEFSRDGNHLLRASDEIGFLKSVYDWFSARSPQDQKNLMAEYNYRKSLVPNFSHEKSLRENLRNRISEENFDDKVGEGVVIKPVDVWGTLARLGAGGAIVKHFGVNLSRFYPIRDGKMQVPPLFAVELMHFWKNRRSLRDAEVSKLLKVPLDEVPVLRRKLEAFEKKDSATLKGLIRQGTRSFDRIMAKEIEHEDAVGKLWIASEKASESASVKNEAEAEE